MVQKFNRQMNLLKTVRVFINPPQLPLLDPLGLRDRAGRLEAGRLWNNVGATEDKGGWGWERK